ncbi:Glycosyl hydrolase family 109 protein [Dissostichus eleginoides]|uniref:Glycosyl hydrolase family 109 protein n=1 Tax=Dissostichus eleginoides TaxID=100907 RepID=A0AAD9B0Y8_DISEL|nr:Glycosyl hydrolase family 109 protein [Dissostichus eleginoides]
MHDYLKRAGELWEDSTGARHNSPETMVLWRHQVIKGLPKPVQTALEDVLNLETQPFHDWKQTVTHWYTRHQRKMDQEDYEVKALS